MLPRNTRKVTQERFQRVATFEVIDQCLYRNPGPGKNGCPTQASWRGCDEGGGNVHHLGFYHSTVIQLDTGLPARSSTTRTLPLSGVTGTQIRQSNQRRDRILG